MQAHFKINFICYCGVEKVMSQGRSRGKAKGIQEFRTYVTRALPVGAQIKCADNTGAKIMKLILKWVCIRQP